MNAGGIVNAADFRPASLSGGAVAQGSIFSLFGSGLSAEAFDAVSFPLPRQVNGVRIEVVADGIVYEAPLLHVGPLQINAIFPSDVPVGAAEVRVVRDGQTSNAESVKVVRWFPGLFILDPIQLDDSAYANQRQQATAQRYVDGQVQQLRQDRPAYPGGDVTLWATGVFATPGSDDRPILLINQGTSPLRVLVGGKEAQITYQAPADCCTGLAQINIRLPLDVDLGCFVPVQLVGGALPSTVVTIPIAEPGQACPGRETDLVRIYLDRIEEQGNGFIDRARVFHGRERFDPNEIPPIGSCVVSDFTGVRVERMIGDPLVRIEAPAATFVLSEGGGPLRFPPEGAAVLGPGQYRVTSTGGNFPNYDATLSVPSWSLTPNDLSSQASPRELGLRFSWNGLFNVADLAATIGLVTAGDQLVCQVDLTLGELIVGPETLSLLDGPQDWTLTAMISAPLHVETEGPEVGQLVYSESFVQTYDLGSPLLPISPIMLPNGDTILAELATTSADRSQGLMDRGHLHPDRGMLFFFPMPGLYGFWMSHTLIPLDILWLDADRRVVSISADTPPCPSGGACPVYSPSAPAQFVLELAAGEAARRNLKLGDQLDW